MLMRGCIILVMVRNTAIGGGMISVFIVLLLLATGHGREVQVNLNTPWASRAVDPIIEVAEFISQHATNHLWSYVDQICSNTDKVDNSLNASTTDEFNELVEVAVMSAKSAGVPPQLHDMMKAAVTLGMHAPAIEFFTSISSKNGEPCGFGQAYVASSKSSTHCELDAKAFTSDVGTPDGDNILSKWDYRYPPSPSAATKGHTLSTWTLHGVPGTSSFCKLHTVLKQAAVAGDVIYAMRPSFPQSTTTPSATRIIQGYGVFLDIKNMEYRNADDSHTSSEGDATPTGSHTESVDADLSMTFDEGEDVSGLLLATLQRRRPGLTKELAMLKQELTEASEAEGGGTEMKVWKMLDLGLQTTGTIIAASDPVRTMADLLHNFPRHASSLSSSRVNPHLREDVLAWYGNMSNMLPSNGVYINGMRVDLGGSTFNLFTLLDQILKETKSMEYLASDTAGVSPELRKGLLGLSSDLSSPPSRGELPPVTRVDVSKGGKYAITFLNNLEKDSQYSRMPKSVKVLTQPSWSLHAVRRNLYTLVAVIDPVSTAGASMFAQVQSMFQQQYPIRLGVAMACHGTHYAYQGVWDGKDKTWLASSEDLCRLLAHTKTNYGTQASLALLHAVSSHIEEAAENLFEPSVDGTKGAISTSNPSALGKNFLSRLDAIRLYAQTVAQITSSWTMRDSFSADAVAVMNSAETDNFVVNSTLYCENRGMAPNTYAFNGIVQETHDITGAMMQLLGREQFMLSQLVRRGVITDKTKSIYAAILEQEENVYERYHPLLNEESPQYIDTNIDTFQRLHDTLVFYHNGLGTNQVASSTQCPSVDTSADLTGLYNTTFVLFPVSTIGLRNALAAVDWLLSEASSPTVGHEDGTCLSAGSAGTVSHLIAFVPQPSPDDDDSSTSKFSILSKLVTYGYSQDGHDTKTHNGVDVLVLKSALNHFVAGHSVEECIDSLLKEFPAHEGVASLPSLRNDKNLVASVTQVGRGLSDLAVTALRNGDDVDGTVVVFNSRALLVPSTNSPLSALDISLLARVEQKRIGSKMKALLSSHKQVSGAAFSGMNMLNLLSFCGRYASSGSARYNVMDVVQSIGSGKLPLHALDIPPLLDEANGDVVSSSDVSLVYVVDPLSLAGQRAAAVVQFIQQQLKLPQLVIFTPDLEISEFPLQNFFRFVSGGASFSGAVFKNIPRQHTLTVRVDAPEAWNVQSYKAAQDIDNLKCDARRCGDVPGDPHERTVIAYRIKNLLIAGQCFQDFETNPVPPNGLQLVLSWINGDGQLEHYSDTLVMQNLGYWQLQANPGLWSLSLAAGRASALYDIVGSSGIISGNSVVIPARSFVDSIHHLYVQKKEGMRHLSLLDTATEAEATTGGNSMWNSLSGMFGAGKAATKTSSGNETIHVFSLATGQVYERLLRIMMLSVWKRTKSPVKFWLFEYYLTPTFKQTVDAMCRQYGFEVGYVTYKWPDWLTQQTVKQRIIWGYKILFLDVLFPLDVKKVIYVDADQVVRADLKELWDMDLEGKPYAYTPFCDSREETLYVYLHAHFICLYCAGHTIS